MTGARVVVLLALAAWCLCGAGCSSDLFHDTSWPSACDLDPSTPGCPAPADTTDAGLDGSQADGDGAEAAAD
jgi:hypothetical protein